MKTKLPPIRYSISFILGGLRKLSGLALLLAAGMIHAPGQRALAAESTTDALPSLFVAPLHGDNRLAFWQPAVGDGLAEMLITELTKLGKFRLLESTTLEEIKTEIKMGDDGWIAPDEKVEKGHWQGADYMFVGKITRFGSKNKSFGGGSGWGSLLPIPGGFDVKTTEADVQIDWRIVDASSRAIVKSGRGTGKEKGTSWGFGSAGGSGFVREHEFLDSALGKATMKAIDEIVAALGQLKVGPGQRTKLQESKLADAAAKDKAAQEALRATPGVVEAVTPQFLVVSLGEKHGLKPGDKLELYEVSEVRNKKGEIVMRDEKRAGEVTVESVSGDKSKARYDSSLKPEEGWSVRVPSVTLAAKGSGK